MIKNFSDITRNTGVILEKEMPTARAYYKGLLGKDTRGYAIAEKIGEIITRNSGMQFILQAGIVNVDGKPTAAFMDEECETAFLVTYSPMGSTLYYIEDYDWDTDKNQAKFVMSSSEIGSVNLIKSFVAMAFPKEGGVSEALDHSRKAIIGTADPKLKAWVDAFLIGQKPKGTTVSKNLTPEVMAEMKSELQALLQKGISPYEIANDLELKKNASQYAYILYRGENPQEASKAIIGHDKLQQILFQLAGGVITENVPVSTKGATLLERLGLDQGDIDRMKLEFAQLRDDIIDSVDLMAKYVKANTQQREEMMASRTPTMIRFLVITGKGGLGKTTLVTDALNANGLKKNLDYVLPSSGSTSAESIYNECYKHNGKIIVFDDPSNVFGSDYAISLWKNLIPGSFHKYGEPAVSSSSGNYYKVNDVRNNRERFYEETARTPYEWLQNPDGTWSKVFGGLNSNLDRGIFDDEEELDAQLNAGRVTKEQAARIKKNKMKAKQNAVNAEPRVPDRFTFTGCIILIMNLTDADILKSMTPQSWQAIKSRATAVEYSAPGIVVWEDLKDTLRMQKEDTSLPDDACDIPRPFIDEFCEKGDEIMSDQKHMNVNRRMFPKIRNKMFLGKNWTSVFKAETASSTITGKKPPVPDILL